MKSAENPEAYVAGLTGWQRPLVESLRSLVRRAAATEEHVKWGHLVYYSSGPVLLIRAEDSRVLFGFWRGRRLTGVEPALVPSGKYEMATITLREGSVLAPPTVGRLVREAVALNAELGDPRDAAVRKPRTRRRA